MESDRAAALSVMNMGVNLVEILSLFASSLLVAAGIGWCGAALILSAVPTQIGRFVLTYKWTGAIL